MGFLVFWLAAVIVATAIGSSRGHGLAGFLLGFFLAWLGVIIVLLLPRKTPKEINVSIRHEVEAPKPADFTPDTELTKAEKEYYAAHTPKHKASFADSVRAGYQSKRDK